MILNMLWIRPGTMWKHDVDLKVKYKKMQITASTGPSKWNIPQGICFITPRNLFHRPMESVHHPKESVSSPKGICFIAWSAFKPVHGLGLQWANVGNPGQAIFRYNTCNHPHPHYSNYNESLLEIPDRLFFLDTTPAITLTLITASTWLGLKKVAIWV